MDKENNENVEVAPTITPVLNVSWVGLRRPAYLWQPPNVPEKVEDD